MNRRILRWTLSAVVGLLSEIRPVAGLLGAAVLFPQGAEGDHAIAYLILALVLNFGLLFGLTYWLAGIFLRPTSAGRS